MKLIWKELAFPAIVGIVMPWLILGIFEYALEPSMETGTAGRDVIPTECMSVTAPKITVKTESGIMEMDLEEYVAGVILCELPETFSMEAKKAQAVVARTYALRTAATTGKHSEKAVCTSPACCQGYTPPVDYKGTDAGIEEARKAANDTQGLILRYEGNLIDATYFSCSGGQTEDAVAVWGTDIPYLRSVESPGEESAAHYIDTVVFPLDAFLDALSISEKNWSGQLFTNMKYTEGGGVASVEVAGKKFSGMELRSLLGLRSTAFSMSVIGCDIIVTTKGFGHRVGMSQYGAEAMASEGKTFDVILAHYYRSTTLEMYDAS